MTTRRNFGAGLLAGLALAGCGHRRAVEPESPGIVPARVSRPDFGDTKPHDWSGPSPAALPVHGVDVARYQTDIDWHRAGNSGVSFAFIKATEGGDHDNPGFREQWHGAEAADIPRGAYHFFYFCTPASEQARWFMRNVPRERGTLPPVLDLEWNPFSPTCRLRPEPHRVREQAAIFSDMVAQHYGQRPILYLTLDFYRENDMIRMDHEEFWLRSVKAHPSEVYPGAGWSFWQYSGTGQVPGIAGHVDLNAFNGSEAGWSRWLASRRV